MKIWIELSYEEVHRRIPFVLIAETCGGVRWDTGTRRRRFSKEFTESERKKISDLRRKATQWALTKGVPSEGVKMSVKTFELWQKLGDFCASL